MRDLVALGVGILNIADRTLDAGDVGGDAFVALAAHRRSRRPLDRGALAHGLGPGRADLVQIVGENKGRARPVGAVRHRDRLVGQLLAGVQRGELGVVPVADGAHEHLGQHFAVHAQFTRLEAFEVDHRHHAPENNGELHHAVLVQVGARQGCVGRAEGHRLGADLAYAAGGPDGLVVQARARGFLVLLGPLGEDRVRESGACAGNVRCVRRCQRERERRTADQGFDELAVEHE